MIQWHASYLELLRLPSTPLSTTYFCMFSVTLNTVEVLLQTASLVIPGT